MIKGILILLVLIVLHEFGHFFIAKACGVQVNEFSIGMGPALFKKSIGGTLYALRLVPFGGYCSLEGESEDSSNPKAFSNASAFKKGLILAAGPIMNFLTGVILILFLVFNYSPVVGYAQTEGGLIKPTDQIIQVDDFHIFTADDIQYAEILNQTGKYDVLIQRNGEEILLEDYEPVSESLVYEGAAIVPKEGLIGKLSYSIRVCCSMTQNVLLSLKHLVLGDFGLRDLSGPLGIGDAFGQSKSLYSTLFLTALISINLGIFNLLPIPALDGGQIIRIIIERIRKKPFSTKAVAIVNGCCLLVLLGLICIVTVFDISRLF